MSSRFVLFGWGLIIAGHISTLPQAWGMPPQARQHAKLAACRAAVKAAMSSADREEWRRTLLPLLQRNTVSYLSAHQYWILYALQHESADGIDEFVLFTELWEHYFQVLGFQERRGEFISYAAIDSFYDVIERMANRAFLVDTTPGDPRIFHITADGIAARENCEDFYRGLLRVAQRQRAPHSAFAPRMIRKNDPEFGGLVNARPSQTAILSYLSPHGPTPFEPLWTALKEEAKTPTTRDAFYDTLIEMQRNELVTLRMRRGRPSADETRRAIASITTTEKGETVLAGTFWIYLHGGDTLPRVQRVRNRPMGRPVITVFDRD